jgi:hypothetical protein
LNKAGFAVGCESGQTFRFGSQEYVQAVLRTFMLLSVAGECPTTKIPKTNPSRLVFFCLIAPNPECLHAPLRKDVALPPTNFR